MGRVLVTGASGFIGRHLVPALRAVGHTVIEANSQSGDISSQSTWTGFPKAEVVVHLAGRTFVPDSWIDPGAFVRCNLLGTIAALDYCRTNGAHLVFLSSYLYGNAQTQPIPETAPLVATNPYALSKKLAEEACQFFSRSFGINVTILRPFNVYGPGQPEHFLIPSIVRQVSAGGTVHVQDLEPKRDYVYVSDLVDAIVLSVRQPRGLRIFNIGTGMSHSVAELVMLIQELKLTQLKVVSAGEKRPDEIQDSRADIASARRELPWTPRVTLEAGIKRVLQ